MLLKDLESVKKLHRRYRASIYRTRRWFMTRDGRKLYCRLLRPDDSAKLVELYDGLSVESKRRRFHYAADQAPRSQVNEEARRLSSVDNRTLGGAVVAFELAADGTEHFVGVARIMRQPDAPTSDEVEAAIVVRDDYHGQGVAGELLRRMVLLAREMKARIIVAEIEADNLAAIRAFRGLDLPTVSTTSHGETTLRISVPYE